MSLPSSTRIRRSIGDAARAAQPHARSVASLFLRAPVFRRALNTFEERVGDVVLYPRRGFSVSDLADFVLHSKALPASFSWRCEFGDRSYLVPVDPAYPHAAPHNDPWGPATYWHRAQNRKLRHVYEVVLAGRPQGTFLDVGANWGLHTYPFAAHGYRCVAFEPQSACCRFIERVRALNRFDNIELMQGVVGADCATKVPFFESEVEAFSSMDAQHVARFNFPFTPRMVDMFTIDALCADRKLSPTFVKIDAEGFEWEVVRGGLRVLELSRPEILVEVSTSPDVQRAMWQALADLGYRCYWAVRASSRPQPNGQFILVDSIDAFLEAGSGADNRDDEERDFLFTVNAEVTSPN